MAAKEWQVKEEAFFDEVVRFVISKGSIRISELQNEFYIGYARAYNYAIQMENKGIVAGLASGVLHRKAIMTLAEYEESLKNRK